jgi:hypothetical protein
MKNKKLSQLKRDLRLVTSRSFQFGTQQSWLRRHRKLILGTSAVVSTGAIIGGGLYLHNKKKAAQLEKNTKDLTPEQQEKIMKEEQKRVEQEQKAEQDKLKQVQRELERETGKMRLLQYEESKRVKELEEKQRKNELSAKEYEEIKRIQKSVNEAKQTEFRTLVDLQKIKILEKLNEVRSLPIDEKTKVEAIPDSFLTKLFDQGKNMKNKIKELLKWKDSPQSQEPPKTKENLGLRILGSLKPDTLNRLVNIGAKVAELGLGTNIVSDYIVKQLKKMIADDIKNSSLGALKGVDELLKGGTVDPSNLGALATLINPSAISSSSELGKGTKEDPAVVNKAMNVKLDPAKIQNEIKDNPQIAELLEQPGIQKILSTFFPFAKRNKYGNRRLYHFGQDNNDSLTPSMFPDMRISLSVQTQFVNILIKYYYKLKSIGNSTLDTLIKPFTDSVKLTESEKNTLINKTVKYFEILYTTYMNKEKGNSLPKHSAPLPPPPIIKSQEEHMKNMQNIFKPKTLRTRQNLEEAEGSIEPGSKIIKKKISHVEIARRKLEGGAKRAQRASQRAEDKEEFKYHDFSDWAGSNH